MCLRVCVCTRLFTTGHQALVSLEGVNGETPADISFESVECTWSTDNYNAALQILPPLLSTADVVRSLSPAPNMRGVPALEGPIPSSWPIPSSRLGYEFYEREHTDCRSVAGSSGASTASSGQSNVFNGVTARIIGRRPDRVTLRARITVHTEAAAPASTVGGAGADALYRRSHFEQSLDVVIVEPLELRTPAYLLMPPGAVSTIFTTLDDASTHSAPGSTSKHGETIRKSADGPRSAVRLSYAALPAGAQPARASVDERGVVHAGDTTGDTVVLVTAHGNGSVAGAHPLQATHVHVAVRPVAQLAVSSAASLHGPLCFGHNVSLQVRVPF